MFTIHASWTNAKTAAMVKQALFTHNRAVCPACGVRRRFKAIADGRYWCGRCRHKYSLKILAGFKGSRLPWATILILCRCFLENYPLIVAQDVTGLSYPTVRRYYALFRKKADKYASDRLSFLGGRVAIDGCYVGKKRNHNQALVLGVVQTNYENLAFRIVPEEEQGYVEKFLYDTTVPWAHVIHDGHTAYHGLPWMGFTHESEIHADHQFKKTCPIERIWALLKTRIRRTYHHAWKESLPDYLAEFRFKFLYRSTGKNTQSFLTFLTSPAPTT